MLVDVGIILIVVQLLANYIMMIVMELLQVLWCKLTVQDTFVREVNPNTIVPISQLHNLVHVLKTVTNGNAHLHQHQHKPLHHLLHQV